ncbi:MAG: hypothetical protein H8F28_24825 [Fibrella sp.]|nr:hypothetical protein [Armatimonadota bacterium]
MKKRESVVSVCVALSTLLVTGCATEEPPPQTSSAPTTAVSPLPETADKMDTLMPGGGPPKQ